MSRPLPIGTGTCNNRRMKTYVVGGAVRDRLLGLPVSDRDHVVVGATPEQMIAAGFQPVGHDFPVFLHPSSHEEYALARTERKVAPGYAGFTFHADPGVTLEDDLRRRDLTVNAMAMSDDGQLIDPYGGQRDLCARVFRHVSASFVEDPVRILRLARFAARFPDFTVAQETMTLMQHMVANGEVDALVAERVWQELSRGLMQAQPTRMLDVLVRSGALARVLPELGTGEVPAVLDRAADASLSLPGRFAVWMLVWPWPRSPGALSPLAQLSALCARLRVPNECRDLATMAMREATAVIGVIEAVRPGDAVQSGTAVQPVEAVERVDAVPARAVGPSAASLLSLLNRCDALRKSQRFEELLKVLVVAAATDGSKPDAGTERACTVLRAAARAARTVDAGAVARTVSAGAGPASGDAIRSAVERAREQAIQTSLIEIAGAA